MKTKVLNYVNRNFYSCFTKVVIKEVKQLSSTWKPCRLSRKGHDPPSPQEVAAAYTLKVGFNQTYDSIESFLKLSETFKNSVNSISGCSVTHYGMKKNLYPEYT